MSNHSKSYVVPGFVSRWRTILKTKTRDFQNVHTSAPCLSIPPPPPNSPLSEKYWTVVHSLLKHTSKMSLLC